MRFGLHLAQSFSKQSEEGSSFQHDSDPKHAAETLDGFSGKQLNVYNGQVKVKT